MNEGHALCDEQEHDRVERATRRVLEDETRTNTNRVQTPERALDIYDKPLSEMKNKILSAMSSSTLDAMYMPILS